MSLRIQLFYEDTDTYNYNVSVIIPGEESSTELVYINPAGLTLNGNSSVIVTGKLKNDDSKNKYNGIFLPVGYAYIRSGIRKDSFTLLVKNNHSIYTTKYIDCNVKNTMVVFQYDMDRTKYNVLAIYNGIKVNNPTTITTNSTSVFVGLMDSKGVLINDNNITIGYLCTYIKITHTGDSGVGTITGKNGTIAVCENIIFNPTPISTR